MLNPLKILSKSSAGDLSILLWVSDILREFSKNRNVREFEVRHSAQNRFQIRARENSLSLEIPDGMLYLRRKPLVETLRKIAVKWGKAHDFISLAHSDSLKRVSRVRCEFARALKVKNPEGRGRFLLRIDDFPAPSVSSTDFLRVHEIFSRRGIPYLLAVTPFLKRDHDSGFLNSGEGEILKKIRKEGAEFALHGFTHEKNSPRPASELAGMPLNELRIWLMKAKESLNRLGIVPGIFVAPFNSYDPATLPELASHFMILCGGPESVRSLGYRAGVSVLDAGFYLPSYRGVYDPDEKQIPQLKEFERIANGQVIPVSIHWTNAGKDNFRSFTALADFLQGKAVRWGDYARELQENRNFLTSRLSL